MTTPGSTRTFAPFGGLICVMFHVSGAPVEGLVAGISRVWPACAPLVATSASPELKHAVSLPPMPPVSGQ